MNKPFQKIILLGCIGVFLTQLTYLVQTKSLSTVIPLILLFACGLIYQLFTFYSKTSVLIYTIIWCIYSTLCAITDWLYIDSKPLGNYFLTPDSIRFSNRIDYLLKRPEEVDFIFTINSVDSLRTGNGFYRISHMVGVIAKHFNANIIYSLKIFNLTLASLGVVYFYRILKFYRINQAFVYSMIYGLLFYTSTYVSTFLRDIPVYFFLVAGFFYFLRDSKYDWIKVVFFGFMCFTYRPTHGIILLIPLFLRFILKNRLRFIISSTFLFAIVALTWKKLKLVFSLYQESIEFYINYTLSRIGNSSGITSILYESLPFWVFYPIRTLQIFFNPFLFSPPYFSPDTKEYQYFSWTMNINNFYFSILFLIFLNGLFNQFFRRQLDRNFKIILYSSIFFSIVFGIFSIDNRRLIGMFTVLVLTGIVYLNSISTEHRKEVIQLAIIITLLFSSLHLTFLLK